MPPAAREHGQRERARPCAAPLPSDVTASTPWIFNARARSIAARTKARGGSSSTARRTCRSPWRARDATYAREHGGAYGEAASAAAARSALSAAASVEGRARRASARTAA